jgi:hypothetical protein
MINQSITADIFVKNGSVILFGVIKKETEKAVKVEYGLDPVFVGTYSNNRTTVNRSAWIPKSQIKTNAYGILEISKWFANNAMKSINIKSYEI